MKYIKKVSASQLISSEGAIIDSMNPGDDHHTNAPSIDAVDNFVDSVESGLQSQIDVLAKLFNNNGTILTSSNDMNNVTEGCYRQAGTDMPANSPSSAYNAYILVLKRASGGYAVPVYIQIWASFNTKKLYYRIFSSQGYGSWTQIG